MSTKEKKVSFVDQYISLNTKDDARDLKAKAEKVYRSLAFDLRNSYTRVGLDIANAESELAYAESNYQETKYSEGVTITKLLDAKKQISAAKNVLSKAKELEASIIETAEELGIDVTKTRD